MKQLLLCMMAFFVLASSAQEIQFKAPQDISNLELQKEFKGKKCNNFQEVKFSVDIQEIELLKKDRFDFLNIEGLVTSGKAGSPTIYMATKKIELEKGAVICAIELVKGEYVEIGNSINLAPRRESVRWQDGKRKDRLVADAEVYNTDRLYPGKSVSYISGHNNKSTDVFIKFYPIQYNPKQKKAYVLTNAEFRVYYTLEQTKCSNTESLSKTNAQNIILTSNDLSAAAATLKGLHESLESVSTDVVTTEWIDANYSEADAPTIPGYATISNTPINNSYNYSLAKKITAYLLDEAAHPNLESVTILGDADLVPPSYYFFISHYDDYNNWICSDLFYASPDYDFALNYELGRIPAQDAAEAEHMIGKISDWKSNMDESWFRNATLVGGIPFGTNLLIGEVITLDAVNKGYMREMNISKKFASKGTETPAEIMPAFSEGNTGLVYHIGHGSGDGVSFDYGSISYNDVMTLSAKDKYPIVVSIACMNGGYDAELISGGGFNDCFAEGLLRSQAGGIAYYGGVRVNYGVPEVMFKSTGEWIIGDEPEMAEMLTYVFQAYAEGNNTLGAIAKEAFTDFIESMDPDHNIDWVTAFEFVFLGDPVFSIMPQGSSSVDCPIMETSPAPNEPGGAQAAVFYFTPTYVADIDFTAETNSTEINQQLYKFSGSSPQLLSSSTLSASPFTFSHAMDVENLFMLSYETSDFKETRTYFAGKEVENLPPTDCELSVENQNQGNYNLVWTESVDPDGSIESYTIIECKNPTVVVDECNDEEKWQNSNFTVYVDNNSGHSGPNCLASGSDDDYVASIVSIAPVLIQEGDSLKFNVKYNIEEGWDYAYVELSQDGISFNTIDSYTGEVSDWASKSYDLSDYVGESIFFRFRYVTDVVYNYDGLFLDDIYPVSYYESVNLIEDIAMPMYMVENNTNGDYYYKVKAIDNSGISSRWSNSVNVEVNIGVEDMSNISGRMRIYPNPAKDNLQIACSPNTRIFIYNAIGEQLMEIYATEEIVKVDLSALTVGTYIIKAVDEYGVITKKIVVEK